MPTFECNALCVVGAVSKALCRVPIDVVFGLSVMFSNVVSFVTVKDLSTTSRKQTKNMDNKLIANICAHTLHNK